MNKRNAVVVGVVIVALFALAIYGNFRESRRSEQPVVEDVVSAPEEELEREDEQPPQVGTDQGVIIVAVESEGPADEAGVVPGDILLEIDDRPVENLVDIREILGEHKEGDVVELTILHGDDVLSLEVTLGERQRRAYLGITGYTEAPPTRRVTVHREWVPQSAKPMILEVLPESPAEEAGLHEGDVILAIDGKDLETDDSLSEIIAAHAPGDIIRVKVQSLHKAEPDEIDVELSVHPEQEEKAYLGISYMQMPEFPAQILEGEDPFGEFHFFESPEGRMRFLFPHPSFGPGGGRFTFPPFFERSYPFPEGEMIEGVMVQEVLEGSPADEVGLQKGDVIASIDGKPAGNAEDFGRAISSREPGEAVELTVFRSGEETALEIVVQLGEHPEKAGKGFLGIITGASIVIRPHVDVDVDVWFDSFMERLGPLFQGKIRLEKGEI